MLKQLIYGNEPYLMQAYRSELKKNIEMPTLNIMESDGFTEAEALFVSQRSFSGGNKALILTPEKLKSCELLIDYLKKHDGFADVYIFIGEVDKRAIVYKAFAQNEIRILNKISQDVLKKTILQYIKKHGAQITAEAYQLFLERINYYSEAVNLFDVLNALKRLCLKERITEERITNLIIDHAQEDVFSIMRLIMQNRYTDVFRQADLILQSKDANPIGVLSLLLRSLRLVYKKEICGCSLKDMGVMYQTYLPNLTADEADKGMTVINDAINQIKKGKYNAKIALKITLSKLCRIAGGKTQGHCPAASRIYRE